MRSVAPGNGCELADVVRKSGSIRTPLRLVWRGDQWPHRGGGSSEGEAGDPVAEAVKAEKTSVALQEERQGLEARGNE